VQTHLDKICQRGLKAALVEMCCVGASVVTCNLGLAVWLGFFQLLEHIFTFIPLATDAYSRLFRKLYCQTLPRRTSAFIMLRSDYNVSSSTVIALNNLIQNSHY